MNIIEVRGLRKSFGELSVLDGVDLNVETGECIGIIGGSGCGKSVFLRCLELLEVPDAGSILIDGREITAPQANVDEIRRSMGMVYQRFNLFSHMNVLDNLCLAPTILLKMPREQAEARAMELLSTVRLTTKAKEFPAVLSGGQQQRIAICRALMMEPKIMLFDEPTSALDPTMVGEVLAVIRMLTKRQLTMLIVTHEMNFAREVSDRILFFAEGGIYEQGTPQEIFDAPQKPLTIAFIQREKYFRYEIDDREFDLIQMHNEILLFSEKYGIGVMESTRLQLCCEDFIYAMFDGMYAANEPIKITSVITYSEAEKVAELAFDCVGREYNPFDKEIDGEDEQSFRLSILQRVMQNYRHEYVDGVNRVRFSI